METIERNMEQILDKKTWSSLRIELNNNYEFNDSWENVINLFQTRLNNYYFKPIEQIFKLNKKGEGFSILTLQCALIEMFAAYRQGKIHNRRKPDMGGLKFEYKISDSCFIDFLHTEEIFKDNFFIIDKNGNKQKNQPFSAKHFYNDVRCGLMHEARTKKDWVITAVSRKDVSDNIFIEENKTEKTKSINRSLLQNRLIHFFENIYFVELKEKSNNGAKLRRLLARKLDHLFDIRRDINYDWWKDK